MISEESNFGVLPNSEIFEKSTFIVNNMSSPPKIVYRITIFFADRRAEVIQIGNQQRDRARNCNL